jgi:hypothetical protein
LKTVSISNPILASGDSGGPLFDSNNGLIGINSMTDHLEWSSFARMTDRNVDWIKSVMVDEINISASLFGLIEFTISHIAYFSGYIVVFILFVILLILIIRLSLAKARRKYNDKRIEKLRMKK